MMRSYLFVPAKKMSVIEKAVHSKADGVIIDLEDAVALSEKENARQLVQEALLHFSGQKPIFVRINDVSTPFWELDLDCAVYGGAVGIIVPKAESAAGVRMVADRIRSIREKMGTTEIPAMEIIPLIETAAGVHFCYEVATADPLISRLAFGSIDFSLDIDCELTPSGTELLYARSRVVIASKAAKIQSPIDSVYPDLNNPEGLSQEAKGARQLGFKGKLTIHPKQLDTVHRIFSPSEAELVEAKQVVDAFEQAEKEGIASIAVNGKLVDYPIYKKALSILACADH